VSLPKPYWLQLQYLIVECIKNLTGFGFVLYAGAKLSEDRVEKKKFGSKSHMHRESAGNSLGDKDLKSTERNSKLEQQKQREIEQQNISPEEIMEEEEKRQPQSTQE
jgi:hypothetical protein